MQSGNNYRETIAGLRKNKIEIIELKNPNWDDFIIRDSLVVTLPERQLEPSF